MSTTDTIPSVLSNDTKEKLKSEKIQLRIENELYLRNHPEIKDIISYFVSKVMTQRPDNIQKFAVELLSDLNLKNKVYELHHKEEQQNSNVDDDEYEERDEIIESTKETEYSQPKFADLIAHISRNPSIKDAIKLSLDAQEEHISFESELNKIQTDSNQESEPNE
ncbi:RIIa domain-containing protein 1 [Globomyces sp. JEL0801]|nr:RIIa domain-containing protein 1 [Globomyces sp. JEL0801]